MLVLTRKQSERLVIGENVVITVVRIAGGGVRLGIEAPAEVWIRREELLDSNEELVSRGRARAVPIRTCTHIGNRA